MKKNIYLFQYNQNISKSLFKYLTFFNRLLLWFLSTLNSLFFILIILIQLRVFHIFILLLEL